MTVRFIEAHSPTGYAYPNIHVHYQGSVAGEFLWDNIIIIGTGKSWSKQVWEFENDGYRD